MIYTLDFSEHVILFCREVNRTSVSVAHFMLNYLVEKITELGYFFKEQ